MPGGEGLRPTTPETGQRQREGGNPERSCERSPAGREVPAEGAGQEQPHGSDGPGPRPAADKGAAGSPHLPPGVGVGHRRGAAAEERGGEGQPRPGHGGLRGQPPPSRPPGRGALRRNAERSPGAGPACGGGAASSARLPPPPTPQDPPPAAASRGLRRRPCLPPAPGPGAGAALPGLRRRRLPVRPGGSARTAGLFSPLRASGGSPRASGQPPARPPWKRAPARRCREPRGRRCAGAGGAHQSAALAPLPL